MARRVILTSAVTAAAALGAATAWAAPPPPMPTRDFVQAAAESDAFEIREAQTAVAQSQDARIRAFAQQMIQDHTRTTQALQQAAATAGLPPPPMALSGDQAMLLSALQGQRGPDFDKTYVRHQVLGHTQALTVERGYADGGSDAAVRRAASSAVPIIQHHLDEARRLCAAMTCMS